MTLYWFIAGASLFATLLNIGKHRVCFAIWVVTNTVWMHADWTHGLPEQAALHGAYLCLALYGSWRWRPRLETTS
ncbi:MAG: hypothetical protein DRQ55_09680 [Planctomycetota bacterium]|nr:MAG: hypothetical protein DRQ55_09680 [Planctomycetota bacterium]